MKMDWDDAPEHIKNKKKPSSGVTAVTVIALVGGILFMANRNGWVDYAKDLAAPPIHSPEHFTQPPKTESPQIAEIVEHYPTREPPAEATSGIRQTSFDDTNYRPKTIVNTIPPPPAQYVQARRENNVRARGLTGSNRTTLRWEDNRQNRFRWEGPYSWSNGILRYDDLCRSNSFPRKGSIEYRGCRRAAKDYLKTECRAGRSKDQEMRRVYCHAENAFRH